MKYYGTLIGLDTYENNSDFLSSQFTYVFLLDYDKKFRTIEINKKEF